MSINYQSERSHHSGDTAAQHQLSPQISEQISSVVNLGLFDVNYCEHEPPQSLPLKAGRSRLLSQRFVYHRHILFFFQIVLRADETGRLFIPVAVDTWTGQAVTPTAVDAALSVGTLGSGHAALPAKYRSSIKSPSPYSDAFQPIKTHLSELNHNSDISYSLFRSYEIACQALPRLVQEEAQPFCRKVKDRQQAEKHRLVQYYQGRREEALEPLQQLFRRLSSLKAWLDLHRFGEGKQKQDDQIARVKQEATQAEAEYRQELQSLEKELEWRMAELESKYAVQAAVKLVGAANLWIPRWECTYGLINQENQASGNVQVAYDVINQSFVDLACDHCGTRDFRLLLCDNGHLVCPNCYGTCACGRVVCRECAEDECHICGRVLCKECAVQCQYIDTSACPLCAQEYCLVCRGLLADTCSYNS